MDDPWGSPWAADDAQLKLDLPAPPPQVHTPQSPHKIASPWGAEDEDDAWGGWNGAEGGSGGADSPGWGRSPGLRPARSGTVSRQVSPEPWGRLGMLESRSDVSLGRVSDKDLPSNVDSAISLGEQPFAERRKDEGKVVEPQEEPPALFDVPGVPEREPSPPEGNERQLEGDELDRPDSPTAEPSPATTAVDRPEPARQASKVQELVHMYDGIAKRQDAPGEPLVGGPRITLVSADGVEVPDEEGHTISTAVEDKALVDDLETLPKGTTTDNTAHDTDALEQAPHVEEQDGPADETETHEQHETYPKAPSIPYAYDLTKLDDLFPSTPTPTVDPEPVPDVIIDDTFASISERKAWYRISRFGPMRQHNLGNDDNYVRLNWHDSEIKGRTLRIVRRWMEEDSITGRVVLGRRTGQGGASMFNWDSQAPQVQIGDLFGKRAHGRSASGASKRSVGSLPSPSSASFAWGSEAQGKPSLDGPNRNNPIAPPSAASPTTASFGWSTAPQVADTLGTNGQPTHDSNRPKVPSSISPPPTRQTIFSMDAAVTNGAELTSSKHVPIEDTGEEEDEWGEMVSSPTWPSEPIGHTEDSKTGFLVATEGLVKVKDDPPTGQSQPIGIGSDPIETTAHPPLSLPGPSKPTNGAREEPTLEDDPSLIVPVASDMWQGLEVMDSKPAVVTQAHENTASDQISTLDPHQPPSKKGAMRLTGDEEATIEQVLSGLPDLSYMLR